MKYTIESWLERNHKLNESLNMLYLIEGMHKTLITIKNKGFWTQEELDKSLEDDKLYQSYNK